ncbi:MAG: DciA family protein [Vicinamibacteria bacterium]
MSVERAAHAGLAQRLFAGPHAVHLLRAAWPAAVGEELARRTEVLGIDGHVLRVRIPDGRFRRVVNRMRPEILAHLRASLGPLAPAQLGLVEGAPGAGSEARPARPRQAPAQEAAPPAEPSAALRESAGRIADPEIRELFLACAARYLRRGRR